jgi:hypothetical protein
MKYLISISACLLISLILFSQRHFFETSALIQDKNTLAVQSTNTGTASGDTNGLVLLNAEINSTDKIYQATPAGLLEPVNIVESNLPLILINTKGKTIEDEPKITAWMSVVNNPEGVNNINDTAFEFDGNIAIEIRGTTSQWFEKKSYNVVTKNDSGTNLNVSLLGLPKEHDWVLYGPYTDKSLIRNVLAYHLGNITGRWSPRTRYCEMYINNDYRGVYVLVEKIKRDKNRVNIDALNPDEISGDDLTGGYVLKIDRPDDGAWISPYVARGNIQQPVPISYVDPKYADMPDQQCIYIKDYVTGFEDALYGENFQDSVNGYLPYINVFSFVDYYLINELSRNLDAYRVSTYFHKDKDSKGGKLTMGPLWDYDLAFGNGDFFEAFNTVGWVVEGLGDGDQYGIPFWWDRFLEDPYFEDQLNMRWKELRSDIFSNGKLNKFIDSCANILNAAQQRNFKKFDILDTYVWPNYYVGGNYTNEVNYLKDWVSDRLSWMDLQLIVEPPVIKPKPPPPDSISLEVFTYPNPFAESVTLHFNLLKDAKVDITIRNILGQTISNLSKECTKGINNFTIETLVFNQGVTLYFYQLIIDGEPVQSGKMIKK